MKTFKVGQKVTLPAETDYQGILIYGHECIGKDLEVMAVFMDEDTEVCAVSYNGINYCFASRILEAIKTEAEKRREEMESELFHLIYKETFVSAEGANHIAAAVIDAGWIKPKPLTDDVIIKLWMKSNAQNGDTISRLALNVESYIRGELEL